MKRFYLPRLIFWIIVSGVGGCHQDPVLPVSAIPFTCQLDQLITIDESIRDTTTYVYNDFGSVEKITNRKWISGQLTSSTDQSFVYTTDHFLSLQNDQTTTRSENGGQVKTSKGYIYTYQDQQIQQVKIINNTSNTTVGYREYTYEGSAIKTYSETDGNHALIKRYTFDGNGKLIKLEDPVSGINSIINDGKIVQRTYPDSTVIKYEFDSGQLKTQNVFSSTGQTLYTYAYTYDMQPYWSKTQLRLRGIPSLDLGEPVQVHNIKTYSYQRYQNNKSLGEQKLIYNHAYNKDGFSLGYGRSDGARQINHYRNCP